MAALSQLRQDLATADRHIMEGKSRIARQAKVVRELDADGHNANLAKALLRVMQRNVDLMNVHRQLIAREMSCASDEGS
jgi:hypothetical protein